MVKKKFEPKESFSILTKFEAFYTGGRIQFTNDGKHILSLCHEKLKKFEIDTGASLDAVENCDELSNFILSDNDEVLVTAAKNGIMRQYDFASGSLLKTWKSLHVGQVSYMALDSSSTLLATGGSDSTVKVWDIVRKYYTHNLKGGKGVFSKICFCKLGSELHIFGAADDYFIHVWNLHSSQCVASLQGHYSTVTDFAFHKEKDLLLSSSRDKVVLIWNLLEFSLLKTIPVYESIEACILAPESLRLSDVDDDPDQLLFITAGDKGVFKVWNADSGRCVHTQKDSPILLPEDSSYEGSLITQATYIPSLFAIGVATFEHNILIFGLKDFSLEKQFVGYNDDVLSLQFVGQSDSHIAVATNSSQIKLLEFPNFSCQLLKGHLDIVLAICAFPHYNNILVSGSKDNSVKVWEMDNDSKVVSCTYTGYGHTDSVSTIACSCGKNMFFVSGSQDTTLKRWDIPEKRPLVSLKLLLTPTCTVKAHDKLINSVDISKNDKLIASASQDHTAKIWDATDLSLLGTLRGHKKGVWCITFSPVDIAAATSSGDETIRIWSLVDFSCLKVFQGHETTVLQVSFLSQGTQIISSASDGNLKLWDIKHNICINTLEGHSMKVWTIAISSSEEYLVSGGADSNIFVWKDVTTLEKEKKIAKQMELVLEEQKLSNLVHEKNWTKALGLAIQLDKPYMAYNIIDELITGNEGQLAFEKLFSSLRQDQQEALVKFSVEWMTNSKTYYPAVIVNSLFQRTYDFQDIIKMNSMPLQIRDMLPYLDRHFKRLNKRCQDMQIFSFLCQQIRLTSKSGLKEKLSSNSTKSSIIEAKRSLECEDTDAKKLKLQED